MSERSRVLDVAHTFPDATSYQVRDELGSFIVRDLLGPWDGPTEQFAEKARGPRDRYLVGMLGPKPTPKYSVDAADEVPDTTLSDDADGEDGELPDRFSVQGAGRIWASSMGLSFAVTRDVDTVVMQVEWGHYGRVVREVEGERQRSVWVRHPVAHTVEIPVHAGMSSRWLLSNPDPPATDGVAEAAVARLIATGQEADPGVLLTVEVRPGPEGDRVVELSLINAQQDPPTNADSAWLFQPRLQVNALDGSGEVFVPVDDPLADVEAHHADLEEQHLRLLYRDQLRHASGRNVAVHPDLRDGARRAWRLTTTWLPTFDVPATVAPSVADTPLLAGLELSMDALAELPAEALRAALQPLTTGYAAWLDTQAASAGSLPAGLRAVAEGAVRRARSVAKRIVAGIGLLVEDPQALDAFRFANAAMALQRRHTAIAALREAEGLDYPQAHTQVNGRGAAAASWRPFQLAFVLLNLPALTDPEHPHRRAGDARAEVDLLFFPTGGGKTEAYLGLAAYTFAIRRLQGIVGVGVHARDGGDGVAVLMRYTLRLLTAQQFQRAAALVCAAEHLRRMASDGRFGATPFRIGLWVGASVAPNWYADAAEQIGEAVNAGAGRRVNVLQVLTCPWCGERLSNRDLAPDDSTSRVRLYCPRGEGGDACPFSQRMARDEGLPILTVDEELYRYTPSMVIATVDKLAQLPWFGFAGLLFGNVTQRCPRHGYRHPDLDARTKCRASHNSGKGGLPAVTSQPVRRLRPPDLIIQDELHLISGALGTTVGLFEGAVEQLCSWPVPASGHKEPVLAGPVIVASTATTKRADAQVRQLYARRLTVFPPQVLDVTDTFFSRQVSVSADHPGRRYLGLCAHGVRLKAAEIRLAEILLLAGQTLFDRFGQVADPYLTLVGYFNATRELAGMRRYLDDDVTSRVRRTGRSRGISDRITSRTGLLNIRELTSRVSSADITDVLKDLEFAFDSELDTTVRRRAIGAEMVAARAEKREPVLPTRAGRIPVDVVLATSMLQVGVDVSRFGLMVVTGQPKNTAEYIQASSRVGRDQDRPGLVVTLYNWSRPRDLAHFEDFGYYHATFYRQVEALSVTPYARRALDRGTAALTIAAIRHADDRYSVNAGAGVVDFASAPADEVVRRLLDRAEVAGGERGRDYLAERIGTLRDRWAEQQGGEYPLGYQAARDGQRTLVPLLVDAGAGPWNELTVGRSMRETENEINVLVPGGDLSESHVGAPPWSFGPPSDADPSADDTAVGDEFGTVPDAAGRSRR